MSLPNNGCVPLRCETLIGWSYFLNVSSSLEEKRRLLCALLLLRVASVVPSISSRYTTAPAAAKTAIPTQKIRGFAARLRFGVVVIITSFALSLSQERNGGTTLPPPPFSRRRRFCRRRCRCWWWCFIEQRRFCRLFLCSRLTRESHALMGKK